MTSLVTHTLARAATIQLRSSFKDHDRMNDRKDLAAAEAAAALLENLNVPPVYVDPILAVCAHSLIIDIPRLISHTHPQILWTAICRVFIGEILRLNAPPAPISYTPYRPDAPGSLGHSAYGTSSGSASTGAGSSSGSAPRREAVRALLDRVLAAMNRFRESSPLMGMLHDGFISVQGAM